MNLHQYRFQILSFQIDVPTLSWQNKVTKCVRNIYLTCFIRLDRLSTRSGYNKRCTQFSSFNPSYKYDSGRDSDCLFYIFGYFEPRTTQSRGLVASVSTYDTRGPRPTPMVGMYFQSVCFSSSLFSILMLNYFIEKGYHQNDRNGQLLTFYIEDLTWVLMFYWIYWTSWGKEIKSEACRAFYLFFATSFINSIIQEQEC